MRIAIKTLGCKSNRYESDRLLDELASNHEVFELNEGATTFRDRFCNEGADALIVNTCTVTHSADRKSRQAIRSFKNANPDCKVVVFGCGVNVGSDEYSEMAEVDFLAKNTDEVIEIFENNFGNRFDNCQYGNGSAHGSRTRAVVKIQDGCNNYCSYCIIPRARGPEYSFPSKKILAEVKNKEAAGYKEIVLTGIIISNWEEGELDLADLIKMLIDATEGVRFRVSSVEPKNFSDKFLALFKTNRLCTHMHMSLQSGSDGVLKRMRRHYDTGLYLEACEKLRGACEDVALTTDVIVGFPGETNEEFMETCDFVRKVGFMKMHVFPYSKRKNTAAYHMKGHIDESVKKERAKVLRGISDEMAEDFRMSCVGREFVALVEEFNDGRCRGYTANYIPLEFDGTEDMVNKFVRVRLEDSKKAGFVFARPTL